MRCPFHRHDADLKEAFRYFSKRIQTMSDELASLTSAVAASIAETDKAIALLSSFKAQLDAAIGSANPRALQQLSDSLAAETTKLAETEAALSPAPAAPVDPVKASAP